MPRSCWIAGRATFTTVLSSMIMKRAKQRAPSVHHLRFSLAKILARISPPFDPSDGSSPKLATTSLHVKRAELGFRRGGHGLGTRCGRARPGERGPADAHARFRRLPRAAAVLPGGAGALLGGGRRGHGHRVLAAVGARRRPLARAGMGDVVRGWQAQPRLELRPPV